MVLAAGIVAALPWPGTSAVYVAERAAYLPAAGIVLLFASLLRWAVERLAAGRLAALLLSIGAAGWAAWATAARIPVWRDNFSLLQAATVADPTDPMPWLELARQRTATGDPQSALQALDEAAKRGPSLEEIPTRQALLWGSLGRWAEAEEAARRATRLRPDDALAWANLGDALTQQSKSAEALEASRRAVSLDSTQAPIWYNYGVSLAATQDLEGAAAAYRRALAIDSTSVEAWNNLGAIYGSAGRLAEAGECYAKAVALAPGSVQARMNLALAYLRQGDKRRAAEQQQAIQRMDVDAARRLADMFLQIDPTMKPPPGSKR
jgi:Flp pilus assembly protein TadD